MEIDHEGVDERAAPLAFRAALQRRNALWEQQALANLLKPEQVAGRSRGALRMRNGTIALYANPSFNTYLCPTERTLEAPPEVIHALLSSTAMARLLYRSARFTGLS